MKKILLFLAIVGGVFWWFFIGDNKLSDERVASFYRADFEATMHRDPDKLCAQFASDFTSKFSWDMGGKKLEQSHGKDQACKELETLYRQFAELGEKMGGELHLDYRHEIHDISFSADRKTATVETSFTLTAGGSLITYTGRSTDTLIWKYGKTVVRHSEGAGSVRGGT